MGTQGNEPVTFDLLNAEGKPDAAKMKQLQEVGLTMLKATMEPGKFSELTKSLGIEEPEVNATAEIKDLLEKVLAAVTEAAEEPGDNAPPDRKDFIKKCMEEGGDMKACAEKYKEKYPDTEEMNEEEFAELEGEIAELAKLAGDKTEDEDEEKKKMQGQIDSLTKKFEDLEAKQSTGAIESTVQELQDLGHIAPAQAENVVKFAAGIADPTLRTEFLSGYKTQKWTGFQDVGKQGSIPAGQTPMSDVDRERIIEEQGLADVLEDAYKVPSAVKAVQEANN